jgi:hypothetical protein
MRVKALIYNCFQAEKHDGFSRQPLVLFWLVCTCRESGSRWEQEAATSGILGHKLGNFADIWGMKK